MRYSAIWPIYAHDWDRMEITGNPTFSKEHAEALFKFDAEYAIAHKVLYQDIVSKIWPGEENTAWVMLAVIHRREGSGDFSTYLGNGQSLHHRTTEVPINRGPFDTFIEGALDALRVDGLDKQHDWRLEKQLYEETTFNGWGYGPDSPYIWGLSNIEHRGKYIRDHVYNAATWDNQPGCAPLTWMIAKLDPSVVLTREA